MCCPPGVSFAVYKLPKNQLDKAFFGATYNVKGACVSTALFMQYVTMGIFGSDFGFMNVAGGQFSFFKKGFVFELGCPITLKV